MSLKTGDVIENAIWITGDEPEGLKEKYRKDVSGTIDDLCEQEGFIHGPITMYELRPGDESVPIVPPHIYGSRVRLLVVESTLVKKLVLEGEGSFIGELEHKDLLRLRAITRKAIQKTYPRQVLDYECDEVIEKLGPEAALDALRIVH